MNNNTLLNVYYNRQIITIIFVAFVKLET